MYFSAYLPGTNLRISGGIITWAVVLSIYACIGAALIAVWLVGNALLLFWRFVFYIAPYVGRGLWFLMKVIGYLVWFITVNLYELVIFLGYNAYVLAYKGWVTAPKK